MSAKQLRYLLREVRRVCEDALNAGGCISARVKVDGVSYIFIITAKR